MSISQFIFRGAVLILLLGGLVGMFFLGVHIQKESAKAVTNDNSNIFYIAYARNLNHSPEIYFDDPKVIELCYALLSGEVKEIDRLVHEGVNVNTVGKNNMTTLLYAYKPIAAIAFQECMELPQSIRDKRFSQMACDARLLCIERLLFYGADPNVRIRNKDDMPNQPISYDNGVSFTYLASIYHQSSGFYPEINLLPLLKKYSFDPNIIHTTYQATPLFAACNVRSDGSKTPKNDYLIFEEGLGIIPSQQNVAILIEAGADIEHRDKWQNTPLIVAAGGENFDIVLMLLEAGADYNATNEDGQNLAYFLFVAKHMNSKIDTEGSIDPYYNKVIAFLEEKGYSLEKAYEELGDKLKNLPKPPENPNTQDSYQRPYDPYVDEWIQKKKGQKNGNDVDQLK